MARKYKFYSNLRNTSSLELDCVNCPYSAVTMPIKLGSYTTWSTRETVTSIQLLSSFYLLKVLGHVILWRKCNHSVECQIVPKLWSYSLCGCTSSPPPFCSWWIWDLFWCWGGHHQHWADRWRVVEGSEKAGRILWTFPCKLCWTDSVNLSTVYSVPLLLAWQCSYM